jgi:hypothetical protein
MCGDGEGEGAIEAGSRGRGGVSMTLYREASALSAVIKRPAIYGAGRAPM